MNGWGPLLLRYSSFYVRILYVSMSSVSVFTQTPFSPFPRLLASSWAGVTSGTGEINLRMVWGVEV